VRAASVISASSSASARQGLPALPLGGEHVIDERGAVLLAVVRGGGASARRPGDASGRARGRRLDGGPISRVIADCRCTRGLLSHASRSG